MNSTTSTIKALISQLGIDLKRQPSSLQSMFVCVTCLPLETHSPFSDSLQIRVDGIPDSGAKSRVETQIKLCVSLTTKDGMKAPYWSYIRIPDSMLARSKLRKSQQQKLLDGSAAAMVSDESKVLDLEARVVCESDENKKIKMCQGCVRREVSYLYAQSAFISHD